VERKTLLLARSSLQRLEIAREADLLRESLRWRKLASSAAGAGSLRPLILGALVLAAGRGRIASFLGVATRVIAIFKIVKALRGAAARRKEP
jgi:hypothetical protein